MHGADTQLPWLSGYTTPLLSRRGWFEPRGDTAAPNDPNPLYFGREGEGERKREREGRAQWERNREEQQEREREQERAREIGRERVGERPTKQESGANRRKGRVVGSS